MHRVRVFKVERHYSDSYYEDVTYILSRETSDWAEVSDEDYELLKAQCTYDYCLVEELTQRDIVSELIEKQKKYLEEQEKLKKKREAEARKRQKTEKEKLLAKKKRLEAQLAKLSK